MHAANVATVTSPNRIGVATMSSVPAVSVNAVKTAKSTGAVLPSAVVQPAPNAPSTTQPNLPLGLLLTVNRPTVNDAPASADYADLQSALRTGNLASAQQAYLRLQSDLILAHPTQTATGNGVTPAASPVAATGSGLNVVA